MIIGVKVILKQLENHKILERAFATYPNYHLTLTGKIFILIVNCCRRITVYPLMR